MSREICNCLFITSGHNVQKWKGNKMESMRDTKRIMEREIKKGSTPLQFERIELDATCYQEIASKEKLTEVLQYLHRVGEYKALAGKTIINLQGQEVFLTGRKSIIRCCGRRKSYSRLIRETAMSRRQGVTFLCRRKNGIHTR